MARFIRNLGFLAGVLSAVYLFVVRPWIQRWGASDDEVNRVWPGDDLIPDPRYETTHAVTINAPADAVWPWLVQIGQERGGFYSYEWLENLLRLDIHNADRIIPEFQHLEVGDTMSLAPDNAAPLTVAVLEPSRALVWRTGPPDHPLEPGDYLRGELAATWAYLLDPVDADRTRLTVRWRSAWEPSALGSVPNGLVLEPSHFIMERKMLLGIKERAEAA